MNNIVNPPGFVTVYVGGQQPFQATSASSNIKKSFIHVVARSLWRLPIEFSSQVTAIVLKDNYLNWY